MELSESRIDEIYNTLKDSKVKLPTDAYLSGPKKMNQILSMARQKCDSLEGVQQEVSRVMVYLKKNLKAKKQLKKIEMNSLLSTDQHVRSQKSQILKEAYAENLLKAETQEIIEIEQNLIEIEALYTAIENSLSNLKDTRVDINRMINLMDLQIKNLGGGVPDPESSEVDIVLDDEDFDLIKNEAKEKQAPQKKQPAENKAKETLFDDILDDDDDLISETSQNDLENEEDDDNSFVIYDEEDDESASSDSKDSFESIDFEDLT